MKRHIKLYNYQGSSNNLQSSCKYRSIFPPLNMAAIKGAKEKIKEILPRLVKV